jgi:putative ATPase
VSARRAPGGRAAEEEGETLFGAAAAARGAPLAARMRPRTLDEYVGQQHLLAPGKPLREAIEHGRVGSMILWGPPGTGKTTLARLLANQTERAFVPFSAVTEGVPRVREIVAEAERRWRRRGGDDPLRRRDPPLQPRPAGRLPAARESGTVTLIGATTQNPSFEINGALLSRARVFVLEPIAPEDLVTLTRRALADGERGLGALALQVDDDALALLAAVADGDARRALTALEAAAEAVGEGGHVTADVVRDAMQRRCRATTRPARSTSTSSPAYHKALRGSDPQGALYWLARMIEGGEDPMYIARRMVRFAAEDVGLADPRALPLAIAARDAYHFLGSPEATSRSPRRPCTWRRRRSRTACMRPGRGPSPRHARRPRRPCRCTSETLPRG